MNKQHFRKLHHERGMSTLVIVLLLLFVATLVTLYTANSMVREQQVSANQYRSDKALSTANAGLDYAFAYYAQNSGPDKNNDGKVDALTVEIEDAAGTVLKDTNGNNLATVTYSEVVGSANYTVDRLTEDTDGDGTPDAGDGDPTNDALDRPHVITSVGRTEDSSAIRTIEVEVDLFGVIPSSGLPGFPLIAKGTAGSLGNFTIINRFSHATIWTGADSSVLGSADTYVVDPTDPPTPGNHDEFVSFEKDPATGLTTVLHASYSKAGLNSDVIENDDNLVNMTNDQFFENFMITDKVTVKGFAENIGQVYDGASVSWNDDLVGKAKGLIWIEGDFKAGGSLDTLGSEQEPVVLIIEGILDTGGAGQPDVPTLIGLLYVIGPGPGEVGWTGVGNFIVQGGAIIESDVDFSGTPIIIYDEALYDGSLGNPPGAISAGKTGTWKDW